MKVFKFGGASVKDAQGVLNVANILSLFPDDVLVVISAIGKTTNLLENVTREYWNNGFSLELQSLFATLKENHYAIARNLLDSPQPVFEALNVIFNLLETHLKKNRSDNYDFDYDRIVSFGEILSTTLVSTYLNVAGVKNQWMDARKLIVTDDNFREGKVDWTRSVNEIQKEWTTFLQDSSTHIAITQGFIAGTPQNEAVTLGREGSDYSAAIFAYALNADSVTIWKDVPGVLNADPKFFTDVVKLDEITYEEAIELSYYGATIIHPKTLKPLQNRNIPLYVKSFFNPEASGTVIASLTPKNNVPSYIFKRNQILITVFPKDFSFIGVDNLSEIFKIIFSNKLKINMMQSTALSFSVCVDNMEGRVQSVIDALMRNYKVKYNDEIELITIRHYSPEVLDKVVQGRRIYLEQKNRTTLQMVVRGYFQKEE